VDIVSTIYKELFTVKLLHSGYETAGVSTISNALTIEPDPATKSLFNGYQVDFRFINNALVCFTRSKLFAPPAKEPKIPFTVFSGAIRMRFLFFSSSDFLHRTYVAATGSKNIYLFSNKISNVQGTDKFISKVIEVYAAAKDYDAGTIVKKATQLYTALQPVKAIDNIQISNTQYWKKINPLEQVVNNADLTDITLVNPGENCFAVVDIYNSGTASNSYNLFGTNTQLLSPVYTIRFKSKT